MDIRNAQGQRVSLLSDSCEIPKRSSHHSSSLRSNSTASTPILSSPKTPSLSRSGSSDTQATSLSSPISPDCALHPLLHPALSLPAPLPKFATGASYSRHPHPLQQLRPLIVPAPSYYFHRHNSSLSSASMDQFQPNGQPTMADLQQAQQFPGVPAQFNFDPQGLPQMPSFDQGDIPFPHIPPAPTTAPTTKKKNSYPCPVSKQYGCNEFFTTSGHAARHAKKHTGKKDAICPECKKAFTRKDNMEQHRRTHSSVRGQAKAAAASASGEEKQAKKAKQAQKKVNRESSLSATAAAAAANAAMPQMNDMMQGLPMSMTQGMSQGNIPAPVAPMDMGMMLDPRLMGGQEMFPADLAQFQQQLQNAAAYPRTSMHGSSYDEAMQGPRTPDSILGHDGQDFLVQNGNGQGSPSVAPALDALALAASRQ